MPPRHGAKGDRQGLKNQPGPGRRLQPVGEDDREDRHPRHQRHQGVENANEYGGTGDGGPLRHIGAVDHDGPHAEAEGEEGVPQGHQHRGAAHFALFQPRHRLATVEHLLKVRGEEELQPLVEKARIEGIAHQDQEQHEQRRHQIGHRLFEAGLDPLGDHEHGHQHEQGVPGQHPLRIADQTVEHGLHPGRVHPAEGVGGGPHHISQGPTGDDAVIRENEKTRQHPAPADQGPTAVAARLPAEGGHGVDRALAAATPQHDLRHHDRNTHHGDAEQIDQNKGAPPVLTGDVGKLPDSAQPHRRAGRRQNKDQTRRPLSMNGYSLRHYTRLRKNQTYINPTTKHVASITMKRRHFP